MPQIHKSAVHARQGPAGTFLGLAWYAVCAIGGALILQHAAEHYGSVVFALFPLCIVAWVAILFAGRHALSAFGASLLTTFVKYNRAYQTEDSSTSTTGAPWYTYRLNRLRRDLNVSPLQLSDAKFRRELLELLKQHRGKWVAYHKDRRVGVYDTDADAIGACLAEGIPGSEIYACGIEQELPPSFGWSGLGWS